jgi:transposase, IS5 family
MLREHYPTDKRFEGILKSLPPLEPELVKIDAYLEDEKLFQMIKKDLEKRYPKTKITGRKSAPVEVILRMLVVKRLYNYSYEATEKRVRDSLSLRQFCRVYLNDVPDDTALIRWANLIQPRTLETFNQRIVQLAVGRKVTGGKKLRTDGTVVESNIHAPSDGRLLSDGVRVLARTIQRGRGLLETAGQGLKTGFINLTRQAKQLSRQIGETLRSKKEAAQTLGRQQYERLLEMTGQTIAWASETARQLHRQTQQKANRLTETLEHFIPLTQQVMEQTIRRILKQEKVPASDKIVSLFEEHTDIICRGKEARPVEYGHKIWLNEVDGGLVSHYRILDDNPSDEQQWKPSLKAHLKTFQHPPEQASGDRGLSSKANEKTAWDLGVKHVVLPKRGYRSKERLNLEHKPWFVKGRHWHAGVEGRISVLKRAHGLGRCLAHGLTGFHLWVGWGVIAGNLAVIGRALRLELFGCQGTKLHTHSVQNLGISACFPSFAPETNL